jgi:hypothetical protein
MNTPQKMNKTVIQRFNTLTGGILTLRPAKKLTINGKGVDGVAEIKAAGGKILPFQVILKNEIRDMHLPDILATMQPDRTNWLLICQYIPEPTKAHLRTWDVNYLEAAGNCFIRRDDLFIFINDQAVTTYRTPKDGKLWKQTGLKFLFAILNEPELLNETYRHQMTATDIAIGNIGPFLEELKEEGYIIEGKRNDKKILLLENQQPLRNKWAELFDAVLRPKLRQGKFRFLQDTPWQDRTAEGVYWGGEPAGALLTNFLQPEEFTLYTNRPKIEVMKELKLVPDPQGKVELMDLFWNEAFYKDKYPPATVPPFLAYAELITSLDSRNRETAERIKQQYLD